MLDTHHLDLNPPNFIANPYPTLQKLRDHLPVFYDEPWMPPPLPYMNLRSTWAGSPSSGAPLARLELQTLFKILLQRLPALRLAAGRVEFVKGFVIRGLKRLPIAL